MPRGRNIVFAVCHPDDEALWVGGLLCELARFNFLNVFVVCLSGSDPNSSRAGEFEAARQVADYRAGVVLGGPLRSTDTPLPATAETLAEGLRRLDLAPSEIDLLVTHAPYGDEHMNRHHVQAHDELRTWCKSRGVAFSFFSCLPIPAFQHRPIATDLRRSGSLHLLHWSECRPAVNAVRRRYPGFRPYRECPAYYLQFMTDPARKAKMLGCYRSINVEEHRRGYSMYTNPCESIYVMDGRGMGVFHDIIDAMEVPGFRSLLRDFVGIEKRFLLRAPAKLKAAFTSRFR